jgi:hypothetical protein
VYKSADNNTSLFGFLLGFSLASGLASYHLLEEYKLASATLQASIEELQASTEKVTKSYLGAIVQCD